MAELNLESYLTESISSANWRNIGFKKRAGVLIPLFTVHSQDSYGIGDLGDLKLIIDWAKLTANSIIQLLPMTAESPNAAVHLPNGQSVRARPWPWPEVFSRHWPVVPAY